MLEWEQELGLGLGRPPGAGRGRTGCEAAAWGRLSPAGCRQERGAGGQRRLTVAAAK